MDKSYEVAEKRILYRAFDSNGTCKGVWHSKIDPMEKLNDDMYIHEGIVRIQKCQVLTVIKPIKDYTLDSSNK